MAVMSKMVLLTTLHLMEFKEMVGEGSVLIDVRSGVKRNADITVGLKIGQRYEVNAIIGTVDGKPSVPVWVIDYSASVDDSQGSADVWRTSLVLDEVYPNYQKAHEAISELVVHLMDEHESHLSNLEN